MKPLAAAALALLAACSRPAGEVGDPDIQVVHAWARPTVAGQGGTAAYMRIANFGSGEDRLLAVTAEAPAKASLHETSNEGGIARMRPVAGGLAIPKRQVVSLEPGGAHIMVTGLADPLEPGERLKLRLRFERSGNKPVEATVVGADQR